MLTVSGQTLSRATPDQGRQASDPLAELARLIGQNDPFADLAREQQQAEPPRGPQPYDDPAPHDEHDTITRRYHSGQPAHEPRYDPPHMDPAPHSAEPAPPPPDPHRVTDWHGSRRSIRMRRASSRGTLRARRDARAGARTSPTSPPSYLSAASCRRQRRPPIVATTMRRRPTRRFRACIMSRPASDRRLSAGSDAVRLSATPLRRVLRRARAGRPPQGA